MISIGKSSGMVEKTGPSRIIFDILNYGFMILFAVACIAPIWHVAMASISDPRMLMANSGILWKPLGKITMKGYRMVLHNKSILTGYGNTLLYVVWNVVVGTISTMVAGFLCSRKDFKLATPLTLFIMFTMMFGGGLIPTYMVYRQIGLINNRLVMMVPGLLNAFYLIMMKSAFEQLDSGYEESAKIDGAGPLTILFRILTPLVKANLAVIIMFTVINVWNSWYPASIYLPRARNLWPLQLFMREILIQNDTTKVLTGTDAAKAADLTSNLVKYCVTIVGTLPILCAYPFAQKYFVTGATLGGVKG
ncbi:MAG: carbohydrate ABC transporter permease [Butyrivibrio sp.]|jgi:putative aldouronate transport system permease protein|nr:carbohydrate ABC transporter permease [Butyrivibrio sp.]